MIYSGYESSEHGRARRALGTGRAAASTAEGDGAYRGTASKSEPQGPGGHHVQAPNRVPVEGDPKGLRLRLHVSSTIRCLGETRGLRPRLQAPPQVLRWRGGHRLEVDGSRRRDRQGPKRGDQTGPNPTDRAKSGTKRHIITDAKGIPLGAVISAANVPDMRMALSVVDDASNRAPNGGRPLNCCLDKGYDYDEVERGLRRRGITPHIRRRGELPRPCRSGKPRRWVVERTNGWHNRYRGLLIRWERKGDHYLALVHLACGLICYNRATGHGFRF